MSNENTGSHITLAFATAILRQVNGAPLSETDKQILDTTNNAQVRIPAPEDNTCSYCC